MNKVRRYAHGLRVVRADGSSGTSDVKQDELEFPCTIPFTQAAPWGVPDSPPEKPPHTMRNSARMAM
jgi:hypothetical protein